MHWSLPQPSMSLSKRNQKIWRALLAWYKKNGRHDLPWRHTDDLYKITVSEIMLQQTNVPKVIEKYQAFVKKFPSWKKLAAAKQGSVVKQWQGLGYNRRALYLHKMAKVVVDEYDGKLPEDPDELAKLPGMGPYTRNAVLVFGRNKNLLAPDVNILRVAKRLKVEDAEKLFPKTRARDFHNGAMDFASAICTKRAPQCLVCPLQKLCPSFPDPKDYAAPKRKEPGRTEKGKHVPRRIFRGRIVEVLRTKPATVKTIGLCIKADWNDKKDTAWLTAILQKLEGEGMIEKAKNTWRLR